VKDLVNLPLCLVPAQRCAQCPSAGAKHPSAEPKFPGPSVSPSTGRVPLSKLTPSSGPSVAECSQRHAQRLLPSDEASCLRSSTPTAPAASLCSWSVAQWSLPVSVLKAGLSRSVSCPAAQQWCQCSTELALPREFRHLTAMSLAQQPPQLLLPRPRQRWRYVPSEEPSSSPSAA
jgi:hypothetical protein